MSKRIKIATALLLIIASVTALIVVPQIKNKTGLDENAAKQDKETIAKMDTVYYDADSIPLASSMTDINLRQKAQEASFIVNEIRQQAGVDTLSWNYNLEECSNVRAVESSQLFSHTRPNGNSWWTVNSAIMGGENLAFGYNEANEVVTAWMNSPTHAQNILYPDFKEVSISVYEVNGVTYWAQEFGY